MSTTKWPPSKGLTTVNVPYKDATLTSYASTHIHAPAAFVLETLRNVSDYSWNHWAPRVSIQTQPSTTTGAADNNDNDNGKLHIGTIFTLYVIMDEKKPTSETATQLIVTDISTPSSPSSYIPASVLEKEDSYTADLSKVYRIGWKCEGGFVSRGLRTERFHEIIVLGEDECEVRTWENQGGVLAHTVKWLYKQTLQEKFKLWCEDLKRVCEETARRGESGVGGMVT